LYGIGSKVKEEGGGALAHAAGCEARRDLAGATRGIVISIRVLTRFLASNRR
jgi:hypothetical protein